MTGTLTKSNYIISVLLLAIAVSLTLDSLYSDGRLSISQFSILVVIGILVIYFSNVL